MDLILTDEATNDFEDILLVSSQLWGNEQRDRYAQRLAAALDRLTVFLLLGEDRSQTQPGLRAQNVGQHVIYYRLEPAAIRVVRILHGKMDASAHF